MRIRFPVDRENIIIPLEHGLTVGRDPNNRIRFRDGRISGEHARFEHEGGHWYIKDLESKNGTYVNGRKISREMVHPGYMLSFARIASATILA